MVAASIILYAAVPVQDETGRSRQQNRHQRRRTGGRHELLDLVVHETLQMILNPPAPATPPNTPTAGGNFSFPPPPQEEVHSRLTTYNKDDTKKKVDEKRSTKDGLLKKTDGNDADESEPELEWEMQPVRRKRGRLSSFSNSLAAARRVPHKKTRAATPSAVTPRKFPTANTDESDNVVCCPAPRTSTAACAEPGSWTSLGSELRAIAEKFSINVDAVSVAERASVFSKLHPVDDTSAVLMGPGNISRNVVSIAINILLWKLIRRMMA